MISSRAEGAWERLCSAHFKDSSFVAAKTKAAELLKHVDHD